MPDWLRLLSVLLVFDNVEGKIERNCDFIINIKIKMVRCLMGKYYGSTHLCSPLTANSDVCPPSCSFPRLSHT